jgi:hypothetical protein
MDRKVFEAEPAARIARQQDVVGRRRSQCKRAGNEGEPEGFQAVRPHSEGAKRNGWGPYFWGGGMLEIHCGKCEQVSRDMGQGWRPAKAWQLRGLRVGDGRERGLPSGGGQGLCKPAASRHHIFGDGWYRPISPKPGGGVLRQPQVESKEPQQKSLPYLPTMPGLHMHIRPRIKGRASLLCVFRPRNNGAKPST